MLMKTATFGVLLSLLATLSCAHAEFRTWTRDDGNTAELELISTSGDEGDKTGEFKMKSGKTISLKATIFKAEDAKLINDWQPAPAEAKSELDDVLKGNLKKLEKGKLRSQREAKNPTKYFLLYYSAGWCGPSHKFTPDLVKFYNDLKPKHDEFELVFISRDHSEAGMEEYVEEMNMPWPVLDYRKTDKFIDKHPYPGTGIPNLILVDLDGNLIKGSYEGRVYTGPRLVMKKLEELLAADK